MTTKTVIDEAIDFETKGKALYQELAESAIDPMSKTLFQSLAKQEDEHMGYIKKYAVSKKFTPLAYVPVEEEVKRIFVSVKELVRPAADRLIGYDAALTLENKGYLLYLKAMQEAQNAEDKKFYELMMKMEQEHYDALANVYYFLTHNDEWVAEDESRVWNWMNL